MTTGAGCAVAIPTSLAFQEPVALFFGLVISVILITIVWTCLTRGYTEEFKNVIIRRIVSFVEPSLSYSPDHYIQEPSFRSSEIFQHRIDRYGGEDHVNGKLGKTPFEFSEIHAEYKTTSTDSKGRRKTHWHTIFSGLFFIAEFNKHFTGSTVVLPDSAEALFGSGIAKFFQNMNMSRDELIQLEDPEFEREFVVYGEDQIAARYILSPSLMRRILDFKRKTGNTVHLSFVHSKVFVAVSTNRNMFEPRVFNTVLDASLMEEYVGDLLLATGIVEDLNLNTRIWTKE